MKVITVFKTHFDIGFTKLFSEIVDEYSGNMLEKAVSVCEATQDKGAALEYKWTMAAWPLWIALQNATPALRVRAEALIARGQLLWHALPFTLHTEVCSVEDLIRGLRFAKELSEKYHKPFPISAKMTDVPGHTRYIVSALAKAGVKFLHLGCNPASTPPRVPTLFFWEAPDGERVLTFYNNTYGSGALPPKGWKYPVWLNMCLTNDNIGPQGPEVIDDLVKECGDTPVAVGSMDDFYREISKCDLSDLPVIRGELADTWIHGAGTYPVEMATLRDARRKMSAVERAYALSAYDKDTEETLKNAYEQSLLFCEHTWGLDVKTTLGDNRCYEKEGFLKERTEPRYVRIEESWQEQRARANAFAKCADELAKKYGVQLTEEKEEGYSVSFDGEKALISKDGEGIAEVFAPVYHIGSKDEVTNFERAYLRRLYFWAIADFGRLSYPETEGYYTLPEKLDWKENTLVCTYPDEAVRRFGMAKTVTLTFTLAEGMKVNVRMNKGVTPYVESCSLPIRILKKGEHLLHKVGGGVLRSEIVPDANYVASCVSKLSCGGVEVAPMHSLLVSHGGDLLCRFEKEYFPDGDTAYFNLFNTMWGTNFPQYIEGETSFDFLIRTERVKTEDSLGKLCVKGGYIEGVYSREDGVIVRIANGKNTEATALLSGVSDVCYIDHFERLGEKLTAGEEGYALKLKPYEIVSVFLKGRGQVCV